MELIVNNTYIKGDLKNILCKIKVDTGKPFFKEVEEDGNNLRVTCPRHKRGRENKPSCYIYRYRKNPNVKFGTVHCFSCGYSVQLPQMVADCFERDLDFANNWLVDNFGEERSSEDLGEEISLTKKPPTFLDEKILENYNFYHPYMWERKLSKEVVDKFKVGYDKETNSLTFPVYNENNRLVLITKRSVSTKHFHIDKNGEKPVYLLNYMINNNIKAFIITEAQIDALTAWTYGFPCCATMGSPSKDQINSLNRSGVRHLITMFDNDEAGREFTNTINKHINKDILVSNIKIRGSKKDINDLTKEEFWNYLKEIGLNS